MFRTISLLYILYAVAKCHSRLSRKTILNLGREAAEGHKKSTKLGHMKGNGFGDNPDM